MLRIARWMAMATVALATNAGAQTLDLSLNAGTGYDSNVFGTQSPQPSAVFDLGAGAAVWDDLERGDYRVGYSPRFLAYTRDGGKHAWNHNAFAEGSYDLTQRTQVTLRDDFAHVENIQQDVAAQNLPNQGDRTQIRNSTQFSLGHQLTKRWSTGFSGLYEFYHYSSGNQDDSAFVNGSLFTSYALDQQTSVGVGGVLGYRTFDSAKITNPCSNFRRPGTRSLNYQGFLSLRHQWDAKTMFSVRAGPAEVQTRNFVLRSDFPCPGSPPDGPGQLYVQPNERTNLTWFAEGSASRVWKRVTVNLTYRRTEGVGGSGSATSINDSLSANVGWKFGRLWNASLSGNWLQRDSTGGTQANLVTGRVGGQDITTWQAGASVTRQLSKRSSVGLSGRYINQTATRTNTTGGAVPTSFRQSTNYDAYRLDLTYTFKFEPRVF